MSDLRSDYDLVISDGWNCGEMSLCNYQIFKGMQLEPSRYPPHFLLSNFLTKHFGPLCGGGDPPSVIMVIAERNFFVSRKFILVFERSRYFRHRCDSFFWGASNNWKRGGGVQRMPKKIAFSDQTKEHLATLEFERLKHYLSHTLSLYL